MAWTPLRESIGTKPLVLAGPILRQVPGNSVSDSW